MAPDDVVRFPEDMRTTRTGVLLPKSIWSEAGLRMLRTLMRRHVRSCRVWDAPCT